MISVSYVRVPESKLKGLRTADFFLWQGYKMGYALDVSFLIEDESFEGLVLDGFDFYAVKFKHCCLIDCTFKNCDMRYLGLDKTYLYNCKFENCKVFSGNFQEAVIHNCNIRSSQFTSSEIVNTTLKGLEASGHEFNDCFLVGTNPPDYFKFSLAKEKLKLLKQRLGK